MPPDLFNNRPYHYEQRLDEHFICHFALPGGRRPKADLIAEFAERLGTNVALVPPELIEPYREFLEYSDMGAMLGMARADAASATRRWSHGKGSAPNPVERAEPPRSARGPLTPCAASQAIRGAPASAASAGSTSRVRARISATPLHVRSIIVGSASVRRAAASISSAVALNRSACSGRPRSVR